MIKISNYEEIKAQVQTLRHVLLMASEALVRIELAIVRHRITKANSAIDDVSSEIQRLQALAIDIDAMIKDVMRYAKINSKSNIHNLF